MNSSWPVMSLLTVAAAACLVCAQANAANTCSARSGPTIAPVVELYTSEGCNSCPPADRWLSALKSRPDVVGLAFHVDYWDRLGWKDRFASAEFTRRQSEQQSVNGARFSYTPQVVVDGHDRKDWPRANVGNERAKAPVSAHRRSAQRCSKSRLPTSALERRRFLKTSSLRSRLTAVPPTLTSVLPPRKSRRTRPAK